MKYIVLSRQCFVPRGEIGDLSIECLSLLAPTTPGSGELGLCRHSQSGWFRSETKAHKEALRSSIDWIASPCTGLS